MKKNVLVQNDLNSIKSGLNNLGYNLVDMTERENVDAIVYMADGYDVEYYNQIMDVGQSISSGKGIMLINATGKTVEDIDKIISNKTYSPLGLSQR